MNEDASDWMRCPSSSSVDGFKYDGDTRQLFVRFKRGDIYRYDNVSSEVAEAFFTAESKGKFVHAYLKEQYPTTKLT